MPVSVEEAVLGTAEPVGKPAFVAENYGRGDVLGGFLRGPVAEDEIVDSGSVGKVGLHRSLRDLAAFVDRIRGEPFLPDGKGRLAQDEDFDRIVGRLWSRGGFLVAHRSCRKLADDGDTCRSFRQVEFVIAKAVGLEFEWLFGFDDGLVVLGSDEVLKALGEGVVADQGPGGGSQEQQYEDSEINPDSIAFGLGWYGAEL